MVAAYFWLNDERFLFIFTTASNKAVEAEIDAFTSCQRTVPAERLQSDTDPPVWVT